MAVASKSTEQQVALGKEVRLALGRKMLVEGDRSLDLLFGILVYTGWLVAPPRLVNHVCMNGLNRPYRAHSHSHTNPIVTNLLQLAMALLADLGLNKTPPEQSLNVVLNYDSQGCPRQFAQPKRTMEERRVAVGLFWLSSV